MDFKNLKACFGDYVDDNAAQIQTIKQQIGAVRSTDVFEKRLLSVLKNITASFEAVEYLKGIIRKVFENSDLFADTSAHHTTKTQRLKEILEKDNFIELNRQFNLSTLQIYVENILLKQLLEINIKIEENQRMLHNMESTRQVRQPGEAKNVKSSPVNTIRFFVVENENTRFAIRYDSTVELLKVSKRLTEKYLSEQVIPYGKLNGLNSRNVIKKISNYSIPKNQPLYNASYKLRNTVEKQSAVIIRKENRLNILFLDHFLNLEPIQAQDMGEFAKTYDGSFKILEG